MINSYVHCISIMTVTFNVVANSNILCVAGTAEDKMRMFIIYYLMTADMSEVCGFG